MIADAYGTVHISTGDLLRSEINKQTALGLQAKEIMSRGLLVGDDLITEMAIQRCRQSDCQQRGFILDGFPRTSAQAAALVDAQLGLTHFLLLDADPEMLIQRVIHRRIDSETGAIYHMKHRPPPTERLSHLVHRADDTEPVMRNRLQVYRTVTAAVVEHFTGAQFIRCDEDDSISTIFNRIIDVLERDSPLAGKRLRSSVSSKRLMAKL